MNKSSTFPRGIEPRGKNLRKVTRVHPPPILGSRALTRREGEVLQVRILRCETNNVALKLVGDKEPRGIRKVLDKKAGIPYFLSPDTVYKIFYIITEVRQVSLGLNAFTPHQDKTRYGACLSARPHTKLFSLISRQILLSQDRIGSKYHRHMALSLPCSERKRVVHAMLNHQEIIANNFGVVVNPHTYFGLEYKLQLCLKERIFFTKKIIPSKTL